MIDELIAKLEKQGEQAVSDNLARGVYGSKGIRREAVVEWLRAKAEARNEASSREQISLARSASDAANLAATSAQTANRIAAVALIIATVSAIGTVIALFR